MITSFAQGFQADPTIDSSSDDASECLGKADVLSSKTEQLVDSFQNLSLDDWAAPLYLLSEMSVASTDVFTYCQSTNFAKQLAVRTSTLAGLFDYIATIGVSFLEEYLEPDSSDLYNAMVLVGTADSCEDTVINLAQFISLSFNYEVPDSYYAEQLGLNLVAELVA